MEWTQDKMEKIKHQIRTKFESMRECALESESFCDLEALMHVCVRFRSDWHEYLGGLGIEVFAVLDVLGFDSHAATLRYDVFITPDISAEEQYLSVTADRDRFGNPQKSPEEFYLKIPIETAEKILIMGL